jgi:hypothetical protein
MFDVLSCLLLATLGGVAYDYDRGKRRWRLVVATAALLAVFAVIARPDSTGAVVLAGAVIAFANAATVQAERAERRAAHTALAGIAVFAVAPITSPLAFAAGIAVIGVTHERLRHVVRLAEHAGGSASAQARRDTRLLDGALYGLAPALAVVTLPHPSVLAYLAHLIDDPVLGGSLAAAVSGATLITAFVALLARKRRVVGLMIVIGIYAVAARLVLDLPLWRDELDRLAILTVAVALGVSIVTRAVRWWGADPDADTESHPNARMWLRRRQHPVVQGVQAVLWFVAAVLTAVLCGSA